MQKLAPYHNVDGLEPAKGMLEIAKHKGLYKNYLNQFMFLNSGLEYDQYDVVVTAGTFIAGHLKSDCLEEFCSLVKSGGYVIVSMGDRYMKMVEEYRQNMRSTIERLESQGRWKVIKDETFPNYFKVGSGVGRLFVFRKL